MSPSRSTDPNLALGPIVSRRSALASFGCGFGSLALADLLARDAAASDANPLTPKAPHFPARAKRVIFVFLSGGPSHVDLFDPKPRLKELDGQPLPIEQPDVQRRKTVNCLASPFTFARHGECGTEVSELLPAISRQVDDLCVIRSMHADNINHNGACLQMNTGEQAFSRPSLGSWATYGLGSENESLPGFVVLSPAQPAQGAPLWSSAFLPAIHQGTRVASFERPIDDLFGGLGTPDDQAKQLEALRKFNAIHRRGREDDGRLDARMASFELAFRMQREAPEAFSLAGETAETQRLYGIGDATTDIFGKQCLLARRLVERGVRFVQVYHTQNRYRSNCQLWDQHGDLRKELTNNCQATDVPVAGLIADLKRRGLLDETLVIWGGEFGRTPTAESADGREHHPWGFTMWLAGGGVRGGMTYGATDEFGWYAHENKVHVHDLHATILHLMGLDHERLTYRHAGRDYRLTDVYGRVVRGILA